MPSSIQSRSKRKRIAFLKKRTRRNPRAPCAHQSLLAMSVFVWEGGGVIGRTAAEDLEELTRGRLLNSPTRLFAAVRMAKSNRHSNFRTQGRRGVLVSRSFTYGVGIGGDRFSHLTSWSRQVRYSSPR